MYLIPKRIIPLLLLGFSINVFSQTGQQTKPKLIVGIIVDQMRAEYLNRYQEKFTESGFKRLMVEGFDCKNTHYNYIPTKTAPGHASVYTGTTPKFHGIIGNSWYHKDLRKEENCVFDGTASTVGSTSSEGERSPHKMLATTITDELQLASQGRSKVIGISIKDRAAILPAGHMSDASYWYDDTSGKFISSTYYMEELPKWVQDFNRSDKVATFMNQGWNTILPIDRYKESTPDQQPFETLFPNKDSAEFPYDFSKLSRNEKYELFPETPYGNTIVAEMAIQAIDHENLGQGVETDFLAISFSSTDKIGHAFGPYSIELEDTYLRLDKDLGNLLDHLDRKLGKENYTLFLTADHAVADVGHFLSQKRIPTGYYHPEKIREQLENKLYGTFNLSGLIEDFSADQFFLNMELIESENLDYDKILQVCKSELMKIPGVFEVMLRPDLERFEYTDTEKGMVQKGYHLKRSGDVVVLFNTTWIEYKKYGTGHGTGYSYDTHVPLLWFGANVPKGGTTRKKNITDIAPTLAIMLGLKFPNAATGQPIFELFED
ncbi:alkaline phosphatase PafA [Flagellimonas amoyensis]|uniref:alkaline phosphatase PafA n=1 Tax=Flagellimonas amoyensis TaxID=2169401 RepID=UPI000D38BABF|nr:alkaline phosphatase PafA [Allomuricauda amoyensis]